MEAPIVEAVAIESQCEDVSIGDRMVFEGPMLSFEKSSVACCSAIVAIYPFVLALRFNADPSAWGHPDKIVAQCPDNCSSVVFELRRIDK